MLEKWLAGIDAPSNAADTTGTVRADATLLGDQVQESRLKNHTLVCDEPATLGGTDSGTNPLEFFMAAVGFCENAHFREARHPEGT